ncbi:5-formyltetrahydrofolate cyclo-ligase [Guggenheimella bovis]
MESLKKELRQYFLAERREFYSNKEAFDDANESILSRVLKEEHIKKAKTIFCFVSFKDEVETHKLIDELLKEGKRVFVPYIKSKGEPMRQAEIKSLSDLRLGYYDILTVSDEATMTDEEVDVVITPGVAFSVDGYRIGYGGGYYDEYLKGKRSYRIGICFDLQLICSFPKEDHDLPVDKLITEKREIEFIDMSYGTAI